MCKSESSRAVGAELPEVHVELQRLAPRLVAEDGALSPAFRGRVHFIKLLCCLFTSCVLLTDTDTGSLHHGDHAVIYGRSSSRRCHCMIISITMSHCHDARQGCGIGATHCSASRNTSLSTSLSPRACARARHPWCLLTFSKVAYHPITAGVSTQAQPGSIVHSSRARDHGGRRFLTLAHIHRGVALTPSAYVTFA